MRQDDELISGESEVGEREGFRRKKDRGGDGGDEGAGGGSDEEVGFGCPEVTGVVDAANQVTVSPCL